MKRSVDACRNLEHEALISILSIRQNPPPRQKCKNFKEENKIQTVNSTNSAFLKIQEMKLNHPLQIINNYHPPVRTGIGGKIIL